MEVAKYLCEFFFCNFWHWLALTITIAAAGGIFNFGDSYHVDDNSNKKQNNG